MVDSIDYWKMKCEVCEIHRCTRTIKELITFFLREISSTSLVGGGCCCCCDKFVGGFWRYSNASYVWCVWWCVTVLWLWLWWSWRRQSLLSLWSLFGRNRNFKFISSIWQCDSWFWKWKRTRSFSYVFLLGVVLQTIRDDASFCLACGVVKSQNIG